MSPRQVAERARAARSRRNVRVAVSTSLAAIALWIAMTIVKTSGHDPASFRVPAHPPRGPIALVAFGDSIAFGECADSGNGFLTRIARDLVKSRPGSSFSNLARQGDGIVQLLRTFDEAPSRADAVVIEIGANDVEKLTGPLTFQERYRTLFADLHRRYPRAAVYVLGVPDIGTRSVLVAPPMKPLYAAATAYLDGIARRTASDHGATFFDFYALSHSDVANDPSTICPDGIHPNDAGHAQLAAAIEPSMRRAFQF